MTHRASGIASQNSQRTVAPQESTAALAKLGKASRGPFALILLGLIMLVTFACGSGSNVAGNDQDILLALTIDLPSEPASALPLDIAGWGADLSSSEGAGIDRVEILDGGCNGELVGTALYGIERSDVAELYGTQFFKSGWEFVVDALSAGEHRLAVRLRSDVGRASACEIVVVTVQAKPMLSIESPAEFSVLLPVRVAGWAIDLGAAAGTGVNQVEILEGGCGGTLLGLAEYGIIRGDVAERYGYQFGDSGWELVLDDLSSGVHTLGVQLSTGVAETTICESFVMSVR